MKAHALQEILLLCQGLGTKIGGDPDKGYLTATIDVNRCPADAAKAQNRIVASAVAAGLHWYAYDPYCTLVYTL